MFPRTEGQAKATLAVVVIAIITGIALLMIYGVSLRQVMSE